MKIYKKIYIDRKTFTNEIDKSKIFEKRLFNECF